MDKELVVPFAKIEAKVLGELVPNFEKPKKEKAIGKVARSFAF